jgi:hypothetical protein
MRSQEDLMALFLRFAWQGNTGAMAKAREEGTETIYHHLSAI